MHRIEVAAHRRARLGGILGSPPAPPRNRQIDAQELAEEHFLLTGQPMRRHREGYGAPIVGMPQARQQRGRVVPRCVALPASNADPDRVHWRL